jgi:phage terminase small subunit
MTPKQQAFVAEYLVDLNGAEAARRAGYSPKTASVQAAQLMAMPHIKEAIEAGMAARAERVEITADNVLRELAKIGFGDIRRLVTASGGLRRLESLDDQAAAMVAAVDVVVKPVPGGEGEVEHVHKIKLWDKRAALVDIGRHLGMFKERIEHSGPDGGPVQINDAAAAARMAAILEAARARKACVED